VQPLRVVDNFVVGAKKIELLPRDRFPHMPGDAESASVIRTRHKPRPKVPEPLKRSKAVPVDVEMGDISEPEVVTLQKGKGVDRGSATRRVGIPSLTQEPQASGTKRRFQESPTGPSATLKRLRATGEEPRAGRNLCVLSFDEGELVSPRILPVAEGQVRGRRRTHERGLMLHRSVPIARRSRTPARVSRDGSFTLGNRA
jgi:hypothetical protein